MQPDTSHPLHLPRVARAPYIEPREVLRRYLSGRLDPAQARAFEQSTRCMPGELRRQLRLARELGRTDVARETGANTARRRWPFEPVTWPVLALAGLVALGWLVTQRTPLAAMPVTTTAAYASEAHDQRITVVSVPDHTATWADSRSIPAVRVDPRAERLDLLPQLRAAQPVDWRLELAPVGAATRWRGDTLGSLRPTLSVPAAQLEPGDYELRVAHTPSGGGERHLRIFRFEVWRPVTRSR